MRKEKKLTLAKETIVQLEAVRLGAIRGGGASEGPRCITGPSGCQAGCTTTTTTTLTIPPV